MRYASGQCALLQRSYDRPGRWMVGSDTCANILLSQLALLEMTGAAEYHESPSQQPLPLLRTAGPPPWLALRTPSTTTLSTRQVYVLVMPGEPTLQGLG